MASLNKMFKSLNSEKVLGLIGLLFLVFVLYNYSVGKNIFRSNMQPLNPSKVSDNQTITNVVGASHKNSYAPFNGAASSNNVSSSTPSVGLNKPAANPSDLLPSDSNSAWASLNPVGNVDLQNINLLNPTQVVGINTQGSSLRNANLQLRSEPSNPRTNTNCPWNISTIEEDKFRKPLEIGTGA
jgi:hypothetical protein